MLGTTLVVLMIGAMSLWLQSTVHQPRLGATILIAMVVYAVTVVGLGRRAAGATIPASPFLVAGLYAGGIAELVHAQFLLTREFVAAALTGVVIGLAHWAALRSWLHLTRSDMS
jgi:hypothetical protein